MDCVLPLSFSSLIPSFLLFFISEKEGRKGEIENTKNVHLFLSWVPSTREGNPHRRREKGRREGERGRGEEEMPSKGQTIAKECVKPIMDEGREGLST